MDESKPTNTVVYADGLTPENLAETEPQPVEDRPIQTVRPLLFANRLPANPSIQPVVEQNPGQPANIPAPVYNARPARLITIFAVSAILITAGCSWAVIHFGRRGRSSASPPQSYSVSSSQLSGISTPSSLSLNKASQLDVNGQLTVNNQLVITPSSRPTAPLSGEVYFDNSTNQIYYYNGSQFIGVGGGTSVSSLGGLTGSIQLGSGLVAANGKLSVSPLTATSSASGSGVLSFQGQTGNISLQQGNGILVSGTTITNSGVTSVTGLANQISVSGNTGNVTLSLPQDIAVASVPTFAGLNLTNSLGIASGGTGALTAAGARSNLGAAASGVNGDITELTDLTSIGTSPSTAISLPAVSGVLCLQSASACGFAPASGSSDYIQNGTAIQTATSFAIQPASGNVGGVIKANGANALDIQSVSGVTVADFDSSGNLVVAATGSSSFAGKLGVANVTPYYQLDVGGDINTTGAYRINGVAICTSSGCTSSSSSGSYIQNGTAAQTGNFNIQSATSSDVGAIIVGASGQTANLFNLEANGGSILDSFNSSGALTIKPASDSATTFQVQNTSSAPLLTADSTNMRVGINSTPGSTLDVSASETTGTGVNLAANNLTTGNGLKVATSSSGFTSGNVAQIAQSSTYTASTVESGNLFNISRSPTVNVPGTPVAIDASSSSLDIGSTLTWSHTIGNGVNRFLAVGVHENCNSAPCVTSVTYAGMALTRQIDAQSGGFGGEDIWTLVNPPIGTANVVVQLNASRYIVGGAVSFFNVDQTNPVRSSNYVNSSSSNTTSLSVTSSSGDMTFGNFTQFTTVAASAGSGQTTDWNVVDADGTTYRAIGSTLPSSSSSTTQSYTGSCGGFAGCSEALIDIAESPGGALAMEGSVASLSSNCTVILGSCADSSNILSLNQNLSSATGAVLNIQNSGSGADLMFTKNSNSIGISAPSSLAASYSLTLPTSAPGTSQCLQSDSSTASQLDWGSCGGGTAGGDLSGTYPNPTVAKLQGTSLSISSASSGQVLNYNGTAWVNTATPTISGTVFIDNVSSGAPKDELTLNAVGSDFAQFYSDGVAANNIVAIGGSASQTGVPSTPIMSWGLSSGNVGIGTASPNFNLDIQGASGVRIKTTSNSTTAFQVINAGSSALLTVDTTNSQVNVGSNVLGLSSNIRGYNVSAGTSASTASVTFGSVYPDANYAVICTPNFNTTCYITNKSTTGFTVNFGTASPSNGSGTFDWLVVH